MPRDVAVMRLHDLPAELEELSDLMLEAEAWIPSDDPADEAARGALLRAVDERFAAVADRVQELGPGVHAWLCALRANADAADVEKARVQRAAKARRGRFDRARAMVREVVEKLGGRLTGPAWRLRTQSVGAAPLVWDQTTPLDPRLCGSVRVKPADLLAGYAVLKALGGEPDDHEILTALGVNLEDLELSQTAAKAAVVDAYGELPNGLAVGERPVGLYIE
jgi:hypothetical protein